MADHTDMGWPDEGRRSDECTDRTRAVLLDLARSLWSPVVRWVWIFAASWGAVILIAGRAA